LRHEQRSADSWQESKDMEARLETLMTSFERIADVLELWADQQK
jgi:hypothetical protein